MLNVNELELRHKKYKRSSYYPHVVIVTTIMILLISILLFTSYNENVAIEIKEEPTKPQAVVTNGINNTQAMIEKNNNVAEEKRVTLSPSLSFIDKIESNNALKHPANIVSNIKEIEMENIEPIVKEVKPKEQNIEENTLHVEDKKSSINIQRKDIQSDIADVIKRFNINHNPALSLFIAKKYYQLSDYEQAYNYALITNDINNNIEGSWIIFSKSLVKMDKKELAIETLKKYISYSNSSQAKQLLDEIISGKFK